MGYLDRHPVVDRARDLLSMLVEHRGEAETEARIARSVHEVMSAAGMFRLMAPTEVGGVELDYPHVLAAIEEIAVGDITASWYVVNSTPLSIRSAYMSAADRDRVMAPSSANFAFSGLPSGRAVRVEGGFEVSGEWPLVTGCADSEWVFLNGVVDRGDSDERPDIRHFILETAGLEIQDNWQHVAGMRGTGSNGVIADKVFVPNALAQYWIGRCSGCRCSPTRLRPQRPPCWGRGGRVWTPSCHQSPTTDLQLMVHRRVMTSSTRNSSPPRMRRCVPLVPGSLVPPTNSGKQPNTMHRYPLMCGLGCTQR